MPQIMVEAFARSLIDNIMIEAFDMVDSDEEKLQMLSDRQESADTQSQSPRTELPTQDGSSLDEPKQKELLDNVVHDLSNLQIGDNTLVPCHPSKSEKQVKNFVSSDDNVSPSDTMKVAETRAAQGEGDMNQVTHDAVIETTSPTCSRLEKEPDSSNEATKVSLTLLHQMIEELETKVEESEKNQQNEPESMSKEKISAWEETVERFIRTIESTELPEQKELDSQLETILRNTGCYMTEEEVSSIPIVHSTPFARSSSLKEVTIEEITSSPLSDEEAVTSDNAKSTSCNGAQPEDQKKRGVFGRTRKLLRNIFGRRKK